MEENLGSLYFDFRARQAAWKQDLAQMDRDIDAYRKKWEAPMRVGGGGGGAGGMGGGGSGSLSPATAAAVASVGGGPNVMGTSNGDVTWNLRQAVRDTGAKYGGGRSSRGGIGMEDGTPDARIGDVAGEFIQQSRIRGELGFSRENSRRAGVLSSQQDLYDQLRGHADVRSELGAAREASDRQLREQRNQDAVDESKYQSENSLMGKLKKPIAIRTLLRGTMAGLVIDAMAGELGNEANYQKAMQLAGMDSNAQSRAELGRFTGGLSAVPFVGGLLNNLARPFTAPIETQLEINDRQVAYQNNQFDRGINARMADQRRGVIAAGPNSYTATIRSIAMQRTGLVAGFQQSNQEALDQFDKSHPMPTGRDHLGSQPLSYEVDEYNDYQNQLAMRSSQRQTLQASLTKQNNRLLGPLDQSAYEAARTGRYNLNMSLADLDRQKGYNAYRPGAAEAAFSVASGQSISDYYGGGRGNITGIDREQAVTAMSALSEGDRAKQRDVVDNLRWGGAMQYNPMIDSPLSFTDRAVESQSDVLESNTKAIQDLTQIMQDFMAAGAGNN